MEIRGKSILITGSSSGIGWQMSLDLAKWGARVACAARSADKLRALVDHIELQGGVAIALPTDITNRERVEWMAEQTIQNFGQVDILINNAAVFKAIGSLWEVDQEEWWSDVTINLLGTFLCCRAVLPHMMSKNQGIIINLTGGGFDRPNLGGSGYGSSKAGIMRLTDTLAFELMRENHNIQVYALNPGFVQSEMVRNLIESEEGQRWLPHVKRDLYAGNDHPAEDVSRAVVELVKINCPELSGRIFSYDDDFDQIAQCADEIRKRDLHQLRMCGLSIDLLQKS